MMHRMMGSAWGNWDQMPDFMREGMQQYWGGLRPFWAFGGILDLITSLLVIALLVAVVRWLWKRG